MKTLMRFVQPDLARIAVIILMGAVLLLPAGNVARADGIIIPEPAPVPTIGIPEPRPVAPIVPPYLTVAYHRVNVEITYQIAKTTVDQVFVNESDRTVEGSYIFPLPDDAAISSFAMYVDGVRADGRILTRDEARRIYEQTVSARRDPALRSGGDK